MNNKKQEKPSSSSLKRKIKSDTGLKLNKKAKNSKEQPQQSCADDLDIALKSNKKKASNSKQQPQQSHAEDDLDAGSKSNKKKALNSKQQPPQSRAEDDLDTALKSNKMKASNSKQQPQQSCVEDDLDTGLKLNKKKASNSKQQPQQFHAEDELDTGSKSHKKKASKSKQQPQQFHAKDDLDTALKSNKKKASNSKQQPQQSRAEDDLNKKRTKNVTAVKSSTSRKSLNNCSEKKSLKTDSKAKHLSPANVVNTDHDDDAWDEEANGDGQINISNLPDYINKFGIEEIKKDRFELNRPHYNLQYMVIDEICLEGLDGITLEALWTRISVATKQPLPFPFHVLKHFWNIITLRKDIEFFKLKEPRHKLILYDRYQNSDPDLGGAIDMFELPEEIYPYCPIKHDHISGSAASFETRQDVSNEVRLLTLEEAEEKYGSQLVMVGTQHMRTQVLFDSLTDPRIELPPAQYCLLERIGRSREQGEITQGQSSLQIISKDPKILFYNRKILLENRLITKQLTYVKSKTLHHTISSLLHLNRFFNEKKVKPQIMTEQIVEVLRDRPLLRMEYSQVKLVFGHTPALKKLFKTPEFQRFVKTDVQRKYREIYPDATPKEWKSKGNDREKNIRTIELINPNVNVSGYWNEEDLKPNSLDDEYINQMVFNKSLLHQVYDYIKSGGPQGKSLKEIQREKGLDFYSIRAAVKRLQSQNLIVGVKLDVGRQRVLKYHTLNFEQARTETVTTGTSENHDQLCKESIDFLSNLLSVEPKFLQSVSTVPDEECDHIESSSSSHALIKKLRTEDRLEALKIYGYGNKSGESLLNQLLTHKMRLDTSFDGSEDLNETIVDEKETNVKKDVSNVGNNSSKLEEIFKNKHGFETAINCLPDFQHLDVHLQEVCKEICIPKEMLNYSRSRRKKKFRKRLLSRINLDNSIKMMVNDNNIVYQLPCPIKFLSHNLMTSGNHFRKFLNKTLKLLKPILSHFKYKLTKLPPKRRFMCRPRMSKTQLIEFSAAHPLLGTYDNSKETNSITETPRKRKTNNTEQSDAKRIKLDDTDTSASAIYMGPQPKLLYHHIDKDNIEISIIKSTSPEQFDSSEYKYIKEENATLRTIKRASHIVDAVRQEKVLTDVLKLHRMIEALDKEDGYMVKVDKKSMVRIYARLVKTGHIIVLHIQLKMFEAKRSTIVICDPSITLPNSQIDSAIEQMKIKFILASKKREPDLPNDKDDIMSESSEIRNNVGELQDLSNNETGYVYDRNVGKDYGFAPKFVRLRLLHEFLFFVIYSYTYTKETIDVKKLLNDLNITMSDDDIQNMPQMYQKEINWKSFIPPLPKHEGWPEGWALICDLLLRLPLSLFVKVFNVSYIIPELPELLNHPVKKFYLVKNLPRDICNTLLIRRKYIFSIHESLQRLCFLGLLQFGAQRLREKDQQFIFLNLNATLLDTTTNRTGYHYVEEKEYKEIKYHFLYTRDIEEYWANLWSISINSNLGIRSSVAGTYITIELVDVKPAMVEAMKPQTPETAIQNDDGRVPGDKRGAAGLDSALWCHVKRNWNWTNHTTKIKVNVSQKDAPKEKTIPKSVNKSIKQKKKKLKKADDVNSTINSVAESKRRTYKKNEALGEMRHTPRERKRKRIIRKVTSRPPTKQKQGYDSIDRKLMDTLKQSRVEWSENEDKILQICQIVSTFVSFGCRSRFIPYTLIRDILHKISPCSSNKTSTACRRRICNIFGLQDERQFLHRIVKSLRFIPFVKKYFSKSLDQDERNISDKHLYGMFVFLVLHFYRHQHELYHIFEALAYRYKVIPGNYRSRESSENATAEVYESYILSSDPIEVISYVKVDIKNEKPKTIKLYPDFSDYPKTETDIILDTIKSILHSTVGTKQEDISWSYQLFRVYENYPDELLKQALTEIQNAQMVAYKKSHIKRQDSEGILLATKLFQFSFNYSFAQITNFPLEVFIEAHEMFLGMGGLLEHSVIGGSYPMECFEQGHTVGLSEISTIVQTHFDVDIPKEVLLLNPNIADHTELIRELAERYKNMLTLIKQGKYFKEDDNESRFSHNDGDSSDQIDGGKLDKIKVVPSRQPMIQRFLKSWFLNDDDIEEDGESNSRVLEDRALPKPDKKKKHFSKISTEESKKILESLHPRLFIEKDKTDKNPNAQPLPSITGNSLSFEDYEKKLENLLSDAILMDVDGSDTETENSHDEDASVSEDAQDSSLALADFSDTSTSILEKYLSSKRPQNVVDAIIKKPVNQKMEKSNQQSELVTNARMQYLMDEELTVEQIMEEMLLECSLEERKVPQPVHLARLLVKGLFPELDEDEERLETLQQHFLIINPDTNLLISETSRNEELICLYRNHGQICKHLLRKVQMDMIISDTVTSKSELLNKLKEMGCTENDLNLVEDLLEYVNKKQVVGASVKEIMENFNTFENIKLSTLLFTLIEMNIFTRTGINHIVYVHHEYREPWLVNSCTVGDQDKLKLKESKDKGSSHEKLAVLSQRLESMVSYMRVKLKIMPWTHIDGTINLKVFEKWMCVVLGHCLSNQMIPLKLLINKCCYLKPVEVHYLVECLEDIGCVHMRTFKYDPPNLFSLPTYINDVPADLTHEFENMYIETDHFAIIKLGGLLNKKLKEFDFPSDESKKHATF